MKDGEISTMYSSEYKSAKDKALKKKIIRVKLSKERAENIGHQITDHKGRVLSEHNWPK